ncbi:hypothetical protein HPQ64_01335 [Rhizobiales bacterium]|uniref:hypothetical protein n=1 Tax=Hongsoonwoonella zoysiae TaxID=2821844 RepID=UPI0015606208|nr:hypothetical protein [Hongsoonwoonella zoysiae]NRG16327.1 hypothetical protein [Hongsoonwoonella zoysiae]
MDRLRHMTLRMIVVAAYTTVMMAMGFLHQPVFAGAGGAHPSASQMEKHRLPDGALPIICLTIANDCEDAPHSGGEKHRHLKIVCEACLVNSGQIAAPVPPVLPLPDVTRSARITVSNTHVAAARLPGGVRARAPPPAS